MMNDACIHRQYAYGRHAISVFYDHFRLLFFFGFACMIAPAQADEYDLPLWNSN